MKEMLEHKGYLGSVNYSDEDELLHGRLEFICDLVTYEGADAKSLKAAFRQAVDDYLAFCRQEGREPDVPLEGGFHVRPGRELHRRAVLHAKREGVDLDVVVSEALRRYLGREDSAATGEDGMGGVNSSVPTMNDFMRPILEYASGRVGEFSLRESVRAMEEHFDLTPEARREMTRAGNVTRVYDRTSWAIMHLGKAGLLRSVRWGYHEITELGREEVASSSEEITASYLWKFPAYRRWRGAEDG